MKDDPVTSVSIRDVAQSADVSMATVSRALSGRGNVSESSRQRVLDAATELGFVPSYKHLLGLGHRTIAHLSGTPEFERDFALPANRRLGFEAAMQDAGVPVRPEWLAPTDFTIAGAHAIAKLESDGADPGTRIVEPEFVIRMSPAVPRSLR